MSFSSSKGFNPVIVLSWLRSEAAERYSPRPSAPAHDPWFQVDPDHFTAFEYMPQAVAW